MPTCMASVAYVSDTFHTMSIRSIPSAVHSVLREAVQLRLD